MMKKLFFKLVIAICCTMFCMVAIGCSDSDSSEPVKPAAEPADIVVYGKIYTAENGTMAEAFAVKQDKFVYVGDKEGAASYIGEQTRVIDHTGKGLILPGLTEGHGHYLTSMISKVSPSASLDVEDTGDDVIRKVKVAYDKAKAVNKGFLNGFGWDYHALNKEGFLMKARTELDKICPDIPVLIYDSEGHKAIVNTKCFQEAGIIRPDGTCTIKQDTIRGGVIYLDNNNMPTGLVSEQACPYVCFNGIDYDAKVPLEHYKKGVLIAQELLLSMGFTNMLDALATKAGPTGIYKACKALDDEGRLKMNMMAAYGIDSYNDYKKEIQKAKERQQKYSSRHFHPDYIKLFMDGTCESGTGWIRGTYDKEHIDDPSHPHGQKIWNQDEVTDLTRIANANGLIVHSHVMGDSAVHMAVKAYVDGGQKELRNQIGHVRHVFPADYLLIKDYDIAVSAGVLWHSQNNHEHEEYSLFMPEEYLVNSFPIKSFFDYGIMPSQSTDFPSVGDSPYYPFGIMQVAITGMCIPDTERGWAFQNYGPNAYQPSELITREQALDMLTINGAWQFRLENERGSIKVGKYADFILLDQDVLTCPQMVIYKTNVLATYFDGNLVFELKDE